MAKVRNTIPWLILATLAALVMIGCDDQDSEIITPVFDTEEDYFRSVISNDPFFASEEATLNDGAALPPDYNDSMGKINTEIFPLRFGRLIESINRNVEFERFDDTLVVATVTMTITGQFLIAAAYSDTSAVPDTLIEKPFTSTALRKIKFFRIGRFREHHRNWVFKAISLVEGGTDSDEIQIKELKLEFPSGNSIVVTSPTDFFLYFDLPFFPIPIFRPDSEVRLRVTLTSDSPETDMVVLRYGAGRTGLRRHRIRLKLVSETQVGDSYERVYELTWNIHFHLGKFNAHVDAVTHGTLFDDTAPVSTSFWGVPYIVQ
ncbi:MAG: hypothetical protein V3U69_03585 [Bacteroidota bacterium]